MNSRIKEIDMPASIEGNAACLCGAVHLKVAELKKRVGACHCNMCRKWSGTALMAVDCGSDVTIDGEENISVFDSSRWAVRGFCKHCGSHLFYRLKQNNQYMIPVGLFSDQEGFVFDHQVFIDKKPPYYSFADKTEELTEAEVFAKYGVS
jgi:hypothetical protein